MWADFRGEPFRKLYRTGLKMLMGSLALHAVLLFLCHRAIGEGFALLMTAGFIEGVLFHLYQYRKRISAYEVFRQASDMSRMRGELVRNPIPDIGSPHWRRALLGYLVILPGLLFLVSLAVALSTAPPGLTFWGGALRLWAICLSMTATQSAFMTWDTYRILRASEGGG